MIKLKDGVVVIVVSMTYLKNFYKKQHQYYA